MNLTLKQKMLLIVLVVGVGLTTISGFILFELNNVFNQANYGNANTVGSILILADTREEFNRTRTLVELHASENDQQKLLNIEKEIKKSRYALSDLLTKYETNGCIGVSCVSDDKDQRYLN